MAARLFSFIEARNLLFHPYFERMVLSMKDNTNLKVLETLYVGIDVSKNSNQTCILTFDGNKLCNFSSANNTDGAKEIEDKILSLLSKHECKYVKVVLESTGIYSLHIANYLSSSESLIKFETEVFVVNPVTTANYSKVLSIPDKNDPKDAYALADYVRSGHTKNLKPFRSTQRLALQRLTRHRKHVVELLSAEKTYVLNNIFLKFSDYNNPKHDTECFSNTFSTTSLAILSKFKSPEQLAKCKLEKLIDIIVDAGKNKFKNPDQIAETLKKAARSSYRLDKTSYDSLNIAIASSLALIDCYEKQIKTIDEAIEKLVKGLDNQNQYKSLISIPGIGPVYAAGILAEIGDVNVFKDDSALAKYIGLIWKEHQSGDFSSDTTRLSKAGNSYLRYYIIEAAGSVIYCENNYHQFYQKKFNEVTVHQHARALVLTARKFVRLIYGLMSKDQLYNPNK